MLDPYLKEMEAGFNAQFDDVRERFAATALDAYHEGYCDYLNACEQDGEKPLGFDARKESLRTPAPAPAGWGDYGDDEIPF